MVGRPSNPMNPTPTPDATRERFEKVAQRIVGKLMEYDNMDFNNEEQSYHDRRVAFVMDQLAALAQPAPAPQGLEDAIAGVLFHDEDTSNFSQTTMEKLLAALAPYVTAQPATGTATLDELARALHRLKWDEGDWPAKEAALQWEKSHAWRAWGKRQAERLLQEVPHLFASAPSSPPPASDRCDRCAPEFGCWSGKNACHHPESAPASGKVGTPK